MRTICIIPCGSKKIWDKFPHAGPTPARDVYIVAFAGKCQEYAQTFYPDSYYILSAKYGFLSPDELIPQPYNVTFKDISTNPISVSQLAAIAREKGFADVDQIVVLAGKDYVRILRAVFPKTKIIEPLNGCRGIGEMMSRVNKALHHNKPIV